MCDFLRCINPSYAECLPGMCMSDIKEYANHTAKSAGEELPVRWISGNVLTGTNVGADGFLGFYHNQIV